MRSPGAARFRPDVGVGGREMRLGGGYWAWLAGAVCSELGSTVMAFALVWTATGFGGTTAGLVTSSTMVFQVLLLLGGGSIGDRFGPRRVMIACDGSMLFVSSFVAVWFWLRGASIVSLVLVGCVLGIVSAFYMPAAGVFPRLFVGDDQLAQVMATTSSGLQLARIAGPAVGGALLAWIGLSWVVALDAVSFLVIVAVVLVVVPPRSARSPGSSHVGMRQAWRALRDAGDHRIVVSLVVSLFALVAGVTPSMVLLFPLLCRGHGWSSRSAGLMEAAFMAAALAISATVAARGALHRAQIPLVCGPLLAGVGLIVVAIAPAVSVACVGAAVVGIGLVAFNIHAVPRLLALSPPEAQVRLQAILTLVVTLPTLVLSSLYGLVAQHSSASWALVGASGWALAAAVLAVVSRPWQNHQSAMPDGAGAASARTGPSAV